MTDRILIQRENAGDDMELRAPRPPEFIIKGRVSCGVCSVSHKPTNPHDTHQACPYCATIIDLTAYLKPNLDPPPMAA